MQFCYTSDAQNRITLKHKGFNYQATFLSARNSTQALVSV